MQTNLRWPYLCESHESLRRVIALSCEPRPNIFYKLFIHIYCLSYNKYWLILTSSLPLCYTPIAVPLVNSHEAPKLLLWTAALNFRRCMCLCNLSSTVLIVSSTKGNFPFLNSPCTDCICFSKSVYLLKLHPIKKHYHSGVLKIFFELQFIMSLKPTQVEELWHGCCYC